MSRYHQLQSLITNRSLFQSVRVSFLKVIITILHLHALQFSSVICAKTRKNNAHEMDAKSPTAIVHKFVYNNEKICGDIFADPDWLPANRYCKMDCKLGAEFCQMRSGPMGSNTTNQRCLLLPMECQHQLKILLGTGFGFVMLNNKKKPNDNSFLSPNINSIPPMPQNVNSSNFVAPLISGANQTEVTNADDENVEAPKPFSILRDAKNRKSLKKLKSEKNTRLELEEAITAESAVTPVIELPQQFVNIPTLAPPKIPPHLIFTISDSDEMFDSMTTTTTTTTPFPPITKPTTKALPTGNRLDLLVPFTNEKSLLPLPDIVLTSSTFPPPRPLTTLPSTFFAPVPETIRTTLPQLSPFNFWEAKTEWKKTSTPRTFEITVPANKWISQKNPNSKIKSKSWRAETEKIDDTLQLNYENLFVEKSLPKLPKTTTILPTTTRSARRRVFSTIWVVTTTTPLPKTKTSAPFINSKTMAEVDNLNTKDVDYDESSFLNGLDANNIFGINSNIFESKTENVASQNFESSNNDETNNPNPRVSEMDYLTTTTMGYGVEQMLPEGLYLKPKNVSTKENNYHNPYEISSQEYDRFENANSLKSSHTDQKRPDHIQIFGPPMNQYPYESSNVIMPPVSMESLMGNDDNRMFLSSNPYIPQIPAPTTSSPKMQIPLRSGIGERNNGNGGEYYESYLDEKHLSVQDDKKRIKSIIPLFAANRIKTTEVESTLFARKTINKEQNSGTKKKFKQNNETGKSTDRANDDSFVINQNIVQEVASINNNQYSSEVLESNIPWWRLKKERRGLLEDRSSSCCRWALDGLCDRSWQRVRELCRKSCGAVVCSSSEGTLSCSRIIDVDVIDCYQQRRTNFEVPLATSLTTINNEKTEPLNTVSSNEKLFAIEEEIQRYNMFNQKKNFGAPNAF